MNFPGIEDRRITKNNKSLTKNKNNSLNLFSSKSIEFLLFFRHGSQIIIIILALLRQNIAKQKSKKEINAMAEKRIVGYSGLIVSTIKTTPVNDDIVSFKESDGVGDEAVFLKDIKEISNYRTRKGKREFRGTRIKMSGNNALSTEEVRNLVQKPPKPHDDKMTDEDWNSKWTGAVPLFCVHGFNTEPSEFFEQVNEKIEIFAKQKGKKYYPIPVLWPTENANIFTRFRVDQVVNTMKAGKLLTGIANLITADIFPEKALMMHSLGNHLVVNGASKEESPAIKFDDIFLVAAVSFSESLESL